MKKEDSADTLNHCANKLAFITDALPNADLSEEGTSGLCFILMDLEEELQALSKKCKP